jgi:hypothetical protein
MTASPLSRRRFLAATAALTATFAAPSCRRSDPSNGSTTGAEVDVSFTDPWSDLAGQEMWAFGERAIAVDPACIDHARDSLTIEGSRPTDATVRLRDACERDLHGGELADVDGWLVPRTLAGLAAGLAHAASS